MAFDGVVISNIVRDMRERLMGGRIYKIYQPHNRPKQTANKSIS